MATMAMTRGWRNGFQHSKQTIRRETSAFGAAAHVDRGPRRETPQTSAGSCTAGRCHRSGRICRLRFWSSPAVTASVRRALRPDLKGSTRSGRRAVPMAPMCVTEQTGYSGCHKFGPSKGKCREVSVPYTSGSTGRMNASISRLTTVWAGAVRHADASTQSLPTPRFRDVHEHEAKVRPRRAWHSNAGRLGRLCRDVRARQEYGHRRRGRCCRRRPSYKRQRPRNHRRYGRWRNHRPRSEQAQVMRAVRCAGSTGRCSPPRKGRTQGLGLQRAHHRSGCAKRR